jgi:negative regulator of sigma E activity
MNEMLDSQLSAMFDDELPAEECELVARRLSRDETLQSRWRHYALIGAAVRGERGLALEVDIAAKVRKAVAVESDLAAARAAVAMPQSRLARRAWQGVAGVGIAAGVAALSVLWMRAQTPEENSQPLMAQEQPAPVRAPRGPDSYVVPTPVDSPNPVPSAELANYVLSHSEYLGPIIRRNVLSSLVASDAGTGTAAPKSDSQESVKPDVDNP